MTCRPPAASSTRVAVQRDFARDSGDPRVSAAGLGERSEVERCLRTSLGSSGKVEEAHEHDNAR